jgi:F-type H+-transporting ATPase subunit epsilon
MTADSVTLPAFDGEIGIRAKHAAMLVQLGTGRLLLKGSTTADAVFAVRGGVAQIADDEIRILAESVSKSGEVDEASLVARLKELDAAEYASSAALAEAKGEAFWIKTQLQSKGKSDSIPDLKTVG